MSLRDDLIAVLSAKDSLGDFSHACPYSVKAEIADECLRQMEWARRFCIVDDSPISEGGPGGASVRPSEYWADRPDKWPPKITLAPEGWKP